MSVCLPYASSSSIYVVSVFFGEVPFPSLCLLSKRFPRLVGWQKCHLFQHKEVCVSLSVCVRLFLSVRVCGSLIRNQALLSRSFSKIQLKTMHTSSLPSNLLNENLCHICETKEKYEFFLLWWI